MKEQKEIITGIDVGTTKIAVIIAEYNNEQLTILGDGITPSYGLDRGEVIDIPKTRESLNNAIKQAEEKANYKINSAFVGITGNHINGMNYSGVVIVDEGDGLGAEIQKNDIIKDILPKKEMNPKKVEQVEKQIDDEKLMNKLSVFNDIS